MEDIKKKFLSKNKIVKHGYWVKSHYMSQSNTGFWSKYGGARYVEQQDLPEWTCQACNEKQFKVLPFYLIEYPEGEKLRICGMCRHVVLRFQLQSFLELVAKVRRTDLLTSIANLLTLPLRF